MSNGRLDYTLGLATTNFLGGLNIARGALAGFIGFATGAGGLLAGVFAQINKGGALNDLSNRTGETVRNLFSLEHALNQSGVRGENTRLILFNLQKSLSGVSETGESTAEAFAAIGLSVDKLRGLSSPDALVKIFEGINKIDRNSAAGAASKIFGRGASGDVLQLARDSKAVAESLRESANQASLFQRNAAAFDKIGDTLGSIKLKTQGLFAGIAEGAAPAIQSLLDAVNSIDFERIGKSVGNLFTAIPEAFKQGRIDELVSLSLIVGFEKAVNFLSTALQHVFAGLPALMEAVLKGVLSVGDRIAAASLDAWAALLVTGTQHLPVGDPVREARAAEAAEAGRQADALRGASAERLREAGAAMADGIRAAVQNKPLDIFGDGNANALSGLLASLGADGIDRKNQNLGGAGAAAGARNLFGSRNGTVDVDPLTRIGAIFGRGSDADNPTRATRDLTKIMARALDKTNATLERIEAQDRAGFANV